VWVALLVSVLPVATALLMYDHTRAAPLSAIAIVAVTHVIATFNLYRVLARGMPYALDAAFWILLVGFICVPFTAQLSAGRFPLDRIVAYRPSGHDTYVAALCLFLGAAGFSFGWSAFSHDKAPLPVQREKSSVAPSLVALKRAAFAFSLVSLAALTVAIARHSLDVFLTSRQAVEASYFRTGSEFRLAFREESTAAAGLELQLTRYATLLPFVAILAIGYLIRREYGASGLRSTRMVRLASIIVALPGLVLVNGPLASSRTIVFSMLFGVWIVSRGQRVDPRHYRLGMFAALVSLIAFFPALDLFRTSGSDLEFTGVGQQFVSDLDYSPIEQSMRVVAYVQEEGHTFGRQVSGAVLAFVPRTFWSGKAQSTTFVVSGDTNRVLGTPIWAEGYLEFGYLGSFGYCAALGAAVASVARRARGHAAGPVSRAAVAIGVGLVVLFARGDMLSSAVSLYALLGVSLGFGSLAWMIEVLGRRRGRSGRPQLDVAHS
jgi:hypothetical protein